jgi:hypothetical protein
MAGVAFTTDLDREQAFSAAARAARDAGFTVRHVTERQFEARRGSLAMSWLLPPVTPYCNFLISVLDGEDSLAELVLERNIPWWTGLIGLRGVQKAFDKLIKAALAAIEEAHGKVLKRREF